jgi:hypothetical protein
VLARSGDVASVEAVLGLVESPACGARAEPVDFNPLRFTGQDTVTDFERARAIQCLDCAATDVSTVVELLRIANDDWADEAIALEAKLSILRHWIQRQTPHRSLNLAAR